ncbi:hypothetical protein IG631_17907 [Alternaria alternata]|nr:hypothetical protein IG631_17907 [Alternaria alternata]
MLKIICSIEVRPISMIPSSSSFSPTLREYFLLDLSAVFTSTRIIMTSELVHDCIRDDLLCRLRWNLLANLRNIEIVVGPKNEEKTIPLFDHPSTNDNISEPSLSRIEVNSRECLEKFYPSYDSDPEPDGYRPPPSLIVSNEDGRSMAQADQLRNRSRYLWGRGIRVSNNQCMLKFFSLDGAMVLACHEAYIIFQLYSRETAITSHYRRFQSPP